MYRVYISERRGIISPIKRQIIYLLSMGGQTTASTLVTILSTMGYQENYIRISLSRMKAAGELLTPERGVYQLAATDKTYLSELEKKVNVINVNQFQYTLIITAFDAQRMKSRQSVMILLKKLGFGAMGNGVYIGIGDKRSTLKALRDYPGHYKAVLTDALTPTMTRVEIENWWDMGSVETAVKRIATDFQNVTSVQALPAMNNLALLHQYLKLIDLVGDYYAVDPMLPKRLIGQEWLGYHLLKQLIVYGQKIVVAADSTAEYQQFFDFGILKRM